MSNRGKQVNPHCVVPGCRTKRPHSKSPATKEIIDFFTDPTRLTMAVKLCIGELMHSASDDIAKGRFFAYHTRTRQIEELYFRALYVLFIANEHAVPHIFSGDPPNSFAEMWRAVNRDILDGRGGLDTLNTDRSDEQFTAMDMLNESAHASFAAIVVSFAIAHRPEAQEQLARHVNHWNNLCVYLNHMESMFRAGRSKSDVLVAVRNLHKPASAWEPRSTETNT